MSLKKQKEVILCLDQNHTKSSIELMRQKALNRKHSEETKLKMSTIRGNPVNIYEKVHQKDLN